MLPPSKSLSENEEYIAEDFNHIFSMILGFAELAAASERVSGDEKLARYIDEIRKCGLRGCKLVEKLVADDGACISVATSR